MSQQSAVAERRQIADHTLFMGRSKAMPRYYFTIRLSNREEADQHGTLLEDDAGALDHACRIVREVQAGTGYDCAGLVIVRNDTHFQLALFWNRFRPSWV